MSGEILERDLKRLLELAGRLVYVTESLLYARGDSSPVARARKVLEAADALRGFDEVYQEFTRGYGG